MAVQTVEDPQFQDVLAQNPKVIVKYFADWCGSCKLFAPKFKRMSDDPTFAGVAFVEINAEHSPDARKAAGVNNLPFLATFKEGKLIGGAASNKEDVARDLLTQLQA